MPIQKTITDAPMPRKYKTKAGRVIPATAILHKNRVKLGLTPVSDAVFDETMLATPGEKPNGEPEATAEESEFKVLSNEEYGALTPAQKGQYTKALKAHQEA